MLQRPLSIKSLVGNTCMCLYRSGPVGVLRAIHTWPHRLFNVIFKRQRQGRVGSESGNAPVKKGGDPNRIPNSKPKLKKGKIAIPRI